MYWFWNLIDYRSTTSVWCISKNLDFLTLSSISFDVYLKAYPHELILKYNFFNSLYNLLGTRCLMSFLAFTWDEQTDLLMIDFKEALEVIDNAQCAAFRQGPVL